LFAAVASAFVASDSAELIFINRNVFTDLLKESNDAHVTGAATLEITKRFRSNKDIIRNIFMRTSTQRSEKDLKFAVEYLKSVKFFARFSFEVRKQLCKAMKLISAVTNTVLFEEGQEGRHFYMIFSGGVEVSVRTKNRFEGMANNVVSRLSEGEYFGELALSEVGGLRRATVTCADFCELLVLGRDQYEPLIKKYQNEYHAQYAKMLSKNPYFIGPEWDNYTIQAMCAVMAEKYFPFRGEICRQGSRATEMFVVTRGECVMVHEGRHPITGQPQQYELGRFGPNSVLGCTEYGVSHG
jgi:CRP-like cAMP-binding protein